MVKVDGRAQRGAGWRCVQPIMPSNPAIASLLQSWRLAGRVAELCPFGHSMRHLIPALMLVLLCGCGRETHVRNKVYSVLPQIEQDMQEGGVEQAFAPEILNPWVRALDTPKVVARLRIALEEMPQYGRASLWMLKAYAPAETWQTVAARYPELSAGLPGVAGYGEHPRMTEPDGPANGSQPIRSETNRTSSAAGSRR